MLLATGCVVVEEPADDDSSSAADPSSETEAETDTDTSTDEGESDPPRPDMGTTPDTDTDGDDRPPGCDCIDVGGPDSGPILPICYELSCDTIEASNPDYDGDDQIANPEALDCALTALRDRTPGVLRWSWTAGGGQFTNDGYVLINDDGVSAVRRSWGWQDLYYTTDAARLMDLLPASTYDDCLANPNDSERLACVRQKLDTVAICDEGWDSDEF